MTELTLPLVGLGVLIMLAGVVTGCVRFAKSGSELEGMAYHGGGVVIGFIPVIAAWLEPVYRSAG